MFTRAYTYYQENGIRSLALAAFKKARAEMLSEIKRTFDRIYKTYRSNVEVDFGRVTTRFNASETSYFYYDFTDDIEREYEVIIDILTEIEPDDIFLDVGANIGIYSIPVAQKISDGEVIAVDPYPESLSELSENATLNKVRDKTTTINIALWNESDTLSLSVSEPTGHQVGSNGDLEISAVKGDKVARDRNFKPTIIKIDVEGAEYNVLEGLTESLNDCRIVYCEIHSEQLPKFSHSKEEVIEILSKNGFSVTEKFELNNDEYIKAVKSN